MEEHVSSLKHVRVTPPRRVAVILLNWSTLPNPVSVALQEKARAAGATMSLAGAIIIPYAHRMAEVQGEILKKRWSEEVRKRMEEERLPFLLIIQNHFEIFEPGQHRHGLIWFDANHDDLSIWKILDTISSRVAGNESVIDYLATLEHNAEIEKRRAAVAAAADVIEVKIPIVPFFVQINASKLLGLLAKK
jgi:hypothetical protein